MSEHLYQDLAPWEMFERGIGPHKQARFGSVIVAMVTPFTSGGEDIDFDQVTKLVEHLEDDGVHGLVVAGTTGEAPTLTHNEQLELARHVMNKSDVPVIVGTGSNSTAEAVKLTTDVTEDGSADGLLVVSPYYNRPSQYGIKEYYKAVAGATDLPVIVYDIPVRTGRGIDLDTMLKLAEIPNIVALKDATGDNERTFELIRDLPDDFDVYSGNDNQNRELALGGAVGAISVAAHWAAPEMVEMYKALAEGRHADAKDIDKLLQPSYRFESSDRAPNPLPAKAMMRLILGDRIGYGRSPMIANQDTYTSLDVEAREILNELYAHRAGA
jgi:4-hydroxy-tetrahydrodipicolinate synthase